ncbi:hypothetical protein IJ843_05360 [bacterium]|nr:hypothetical protein [bacterium]
MKKLYIILLLMILIVSAVNADELEVQNDKKNDENVVDFSKMKFSENENPVTYKYFQDYADLLRSNIDFNKFYFFGFRPKDLGWYMKYHYKLHKDGTISELSSALGCSPREGKPINKYYENIIKTVLPPSFPDNMEIGDDVYVILIVERKARTRTEILFLNLSGIYEGNTVIIRIYKKSWDNVINRKYEYLRYAQWQYRKDIDDAY